MAPNCFVASFSQMAMSGAVLERGLKIGSNVHTVEFEAFTAVDEATAAQQISLNVLTFST
jgi:hypothetical protein